MVTVSVLSSMMLAVWFATIPKKTARRFVQLIATGQSVEAKMMIETAVDPEALAPWFWFHRDGFDWAPSDVQARPRSLLQLLTGRAVYLTPDGLELSVSGESIELAKPSYEYFGPARRLPLSPVNWRQYELSPDCPKRAASPQQTSALPISSGKPRPKGNRSHRPKPVNCRSLRNASCSTPSNRRLRMRCRFLSKGITRDTSKPLPF